MNYLQSIAFDKLTLKNKSDLIIILYNTCYLNYTNNDNDDDLVNGNNNNAYYYYHTYVLSQNYRKQITHVVVVLYYPGPLAVIHNTYKFTTSRGVH